MADDDDVVQITAESTGDVAARDRDAWTRPLYARIAPEIVGMYTERWSAPVRVKFVPGDDGFVDVMLERQAPEADMVSALELIDRDGCARSTGERCWDLGYVRGAKYGEDAWCYACVARAALEGRRA